MSSSNLTVLIEISLLFIELTAPSLCIKEIKCFTAFCSGSEF